jgi:CO/xanthine dehydrogenase Mo-binding subunit
LGFLGRRRRDSIVPPLAAIAKAVSNAAGVRLTHIPMSPPRVLAAIEIA